MTLLIPNHSIYIFPYAVLIVAILSTWFANIFLSWSLFILSIICAVILDRIDYVGILWIVLMASISISVKQYPAQRMVALVILAGFAVLASAHLLPGFNNFLWLDNMQLSEASLQFKTWLNFDKPAAAFIILVTLRETAKNYCHWRQAVIAYLTWLPSIMTMIMLGWLVGFVRLDVTIPTWTLSWLLVNLILVCIAEEVIFRSLIQQNILLPFLKPIHALFLSSLLFGALHYHGGILLALLATIAGVFYGAALLQKRRIETAIFLHFSLNAIHFMFFTYPAAT